MHLVVWNESKIVWFDCKSNLCCRRVDRSPNLVWNATKLLIYNIYIGTAEVFSADYDVY